MKHLKIYARLSRTKGEDVSIDRQLALGHTYAKSRKDCVHDCATDDLVEPHGHRSGISEAARPKFRELLEWSKSERNSVLWVVDQSRFSRGDDVVTLLKQFEKRGHEFVIDGKRIDIREFEDELSVRTNAFINAIYSLTLSNKQRRRIRAEKTAGAWIGRVPLGLKTEGKGLARHLVASDKNYSTDGKTRKYLDTIIAWFRLYTAARFVGAPTGARLLNQRGFRWWSKQFEPVLVTAHDLNNLNPCHYRGILDSDLVERAIRRKAERANRRNNGPNPIHPPLLLRGIVFCEHCGKRYTTNTYRNLRLYRHYRGDCTYEGSIVAHKLENHILELLRTRTAFSLEKQRELYTKAQVAPDTNGDRRKELLATLSRLEDLAIDGSISKEKYLLRKRETERELMQLPPAVAPRPRMSETEFIERTKTVVQMLEHIRNSDAYLANRLMCDMIRGIWVLNGEYMRGELTTDFLEMFGGQITL